MTSRSVLISPVSSDSSDDCTTITANFDERSVTTERTSGYGTFTAMKNNDEPEVPVDSGTPKATVVLGNDRWSSEEWTNMLFDVTLPFQTVFVVSFLTLLYPFELFCFHLHPDVFVAERSVRFDRGAGTITMTGVPRYSIKVENSSLWVSYTCAAGYCFVCLCVFFPIAIVLAIIVRGIGRRIILNISETCFDFPSFL